MMSLTKSLRNIKRFSRPNIRGINTDSVKIVELGARDGLQNEKKIVPTSVKLELINKLGESGLKTIEAASFVHPKWVPQMADGAEIMKTLKRIPGVNYPVSVPNLKGYEAARACNVAEVALFPGTTEGFSQKNLNCSVQESIAKFKKVADQATKDGVRVRSYISCVVGCPYEGAVNPKKVANVVEQLLDMGCYEVSLADTIGVGTPGSVKNMLKEVLNVAKPEQLAVHFHDSYGQALSNVLISMEFGIRTVDSSVSGLGGCPFAPGATGNLATEDLVYLLYGLGVETGVDLIKLNAAGRYIMNYLGKPTESRVNRALGDKYYNSGDVSKIAMCQVG